MFTQSRTFRAGVIAAIGIGLLAGCSSGESDPAATYDPNEEVTLDFAFWGNDVRAGLYVDAIAAFNEEYPNITVNSQFLTFPEFWEKRQTEAAGGGLPDVMQFDYSYLRQYAQNGLLLDLGPYLDNVIDTEPLADNILNIGAVDDVTYAVPTSTNAWSLYTNPDLLAEVGVDKFAGGD
ncbi:ABC transporter substrate-binding protein [Microbacterium paludicola]|uniref:ABC transporter substrate-binding protein n=1 Tax=Microbacterium paludicola TaxID=300019 RepID=UPI0021B67A21|nr:extracellular solute-binding protein [Microbacterium paludicola]